MHASEQTAMNVRAAGIVKANTLTSIFQPQTEPMRFRDYVGAAVVTLAGFALAYFAWIATP